MAKRNTINELKLKQDNILDFVKNISAQWNPEALRRSSVYTAEYFLKNLPHYLEKTDLSTLSSLEFYQPLTSLKIFGNLKAKNHAFQFSSVQWGFQFQETQLTKGIAYFLRKKINRLASWYFIQSLIDTATSQSEKIPKPIYLNKEDFLATVKVFSEQKTLENTRVDIVFEWGRGENKKIVLIECKLGSSLTETQLPSYQKHAEKKVKNIKSQAYFFVIGQKLNPKNEMILKKETNQQWQYTNWCNLLLQWEKHLTKSNENLSNQSDFHQFRRTLWGRTIGY